MAIVCQPSYPLNSENARPPGTFTVYLSGLPCANMTKPPRTARHTVTVPIVSALLRFIAVPPVTETPVVVMLPPKSAVTASHQTGVRCVYQTKVSTPPFSHEIRYQNLMDDCGCGARG